MLVVRREHAEIGMACQPRIDGSIFRQPDHWLRGMTAKPSLQAFSVPLPDEQHYSVFSTASRSVRT